MQDIITLDHGSGGLKTSQLIDEILVPAFANTALADLGDAAIVPGGGPLVFSTDSFVVTPWRFPGGDIGKLAVCGTVNDLCMAGGDPKYLSCALILEEGFPLDDLRAVAASMAAAAREAGVQIVTGDTKVVARGQGDGVYINTAGVGVLRTPGLGRAGLREGDAVLISGSAGCHGAAVLMARGGLPGGAALQSDCRCLRALAAACDLLGLDPLYSACEGRLLAVAAPESAAAVLAALRALPGGEGAARIGTVTARRPGTVVLRTALGGSRILGKLAGAQLPRIC